MYVPLGDDQYIELLCVTNQASKHPMVRTLLRILADGDRLFNFAITADDIELEAKRLGEPIFDLTTTGAQDKHVSFRLTGASGIVGPEPLPFFVQTTAGRQWRGGFRPARHRVDPKGVIRVEYGGNAERVARRVADPQFPIRVVDGRPGLNAIWIALNDREFELRA